MPRSNHGVHIRLMKIGDVPAALQVIDTVGWIQTATDWERFLSLSPYGCFVAELEGKIVGTITAVPYERVLGWIGMLVVRPEHQREGIGGMLLKVAINFLGYLGIPTVKLDATPEGERLYQVYGFHHESKVLRYSGMISDPPDRRVAEIPSTIVKVTGDDFPEICAFDNTLFPVSRDDVLVNLFRCNPEMAWISRNEKKKDTLEGYSFGRKMREGWHIGPLGARDISIVQDLFNQYARFLENEKLFVDIHERNRDMVNFVENRGFSLEREFSRMYRGIKGPKAACQREYATSGPELG